MMNILGKKKSFPSVYQNTELSFKQYSLNQRLGFELPITRKENLCTVRPTSWILLMSTMEIFNKKKNLQM